MGWRLDFKRLRVYLEEKYFIKKAYVFIGYVPENKNLYSFLRKMGYIIIFKPILKDRKSGIKGNCDAELVLHCILESKNFDKAVIISGDGDFHCLLEHLAKNNKLFKLGIPNQCKYSALLRKFSDYFFYVSKLRKELEYK